MNYYEILKVSQKASEKEIKDSYKSLVKKYHPDLYKDDKNFAENKIKQINEAYEILSDTKKRKEYDESLNPPVYTRSIFTENILQIILLQTIRKILSQTLPHKILQI